MHRKEIITALIDKGGLGLEIGPSINPVARKADGYKVHIVDHLSQADLLLKYQDHGVKLENIEPVDFIWKGEPLREVVNNGLVYDWIIASHVIEHVPDPIRFLRDCQTILKPGGIISLAIPDKRYCFDALRSPSSPGDLLQAFLEQRVRHTAGQIYDSFAFSTKRDGVISWDKETTGPLEWMHAPGYAGVELENFIRFNNYVDAHAWVFTPHSFRLAVLDLNLLGYLKIHEESFMPTIGCEFFVNFRNQPFSGSGDRMELALRARAEAAER
jgi:SAM-dependent methyltransferase